MAPHPSWRILFLQFLSGVVSTFANVTAGKWFEQGESSWVWAVVRAGLSYHGAVMSEYRDAMAQDDAKRLTDLNRWLASIFLDFAKHAELHRPETVAALEETLGENPGRCVKFSPSTG